MVSTKIGSDGCFDHNRSQSYTENSALHAYLPCTGTLAAANIHSCTPQAHSAEHMNVREGLQNHLSE